MNTEDRRRAYLAAMGIDLWQRRTPVPAAALPEASTSVPPPIGVQPYLEQPPPASPAPSPPSRSAFASPTPAAPLTQVSDVAALDWPGLAQVVAACMRCGLRAGCKQTVFGVGDPQARWLFVGEAPGADEDEQGEPFVGRAGQLLNAMIAAVGLQREEVYIANVLKCRPPGNRDPQPQEVAYCEPFLVRQIELIRPRLIVALGRHAAHSLLKTELALAKLRGQRLSYHNTPLIVTYHPAYLLRSPADKRKAWQDLRLARAVAAEP